MEFNWYDYDSPRVSELVKNYGNSVFDTPEWLKERFTRYRQQDNFNARYHNYYFRDWI
jgi:hypothetical protein